MIGREGETLSLNHMFLTLNFPTGKKVNMRVVIAICIVLDWLAFFILGSIALVSVQGIWSDYANTKTSLSWSSEAISSHPAVTMCFASKSEDPKMFDLGTEMNITYILESKSSMILKENANTSPEFGDEVVHLERQFACYKISSNAIPTKGEERSIKVEINPHLEWIHDRLATHILFILTSAQNSYGVYEEIYIDGNPYETRVRLQHQLKTILKPKKMEYLKEVRGGCEDSGFWYVVESTFASEIKRKCPVPCAPYKLPNGTLGDCLKMGIPKTEFKCCYSVLFEVINNVLQNGFAPCTKIEYTGKESGYSVIEGIKEIVFDPLDPKLEPYIEFPPHTEITPTVIFTYKFDTPETTDVFSEYIIVDTMTMIGSIGGTLGLYLGFSFFDFAMQILGWIQILVVKISQSSLFKEEKKKECKKDQTKEPKKDEKNEVKPEQPKKTQVAPQPKNAA